MTKLAEMAPVPTGMICITLHSNAKGTSARRGGLTLSDCNVDSPVMSTSLSSGNSILLDMLMNSACCSVEALMTNSPFASMLINVSFLPPSRFNVGENTTTGGFAPNALKKLNGAKLTTPDLDSVVTQAIGRGVTSPTSIW